MENKKFIMYNKLGQTGRSFQKRLKDHLGSFRNENGKSNYANHLLEENHRFNDNFEILHTADKGSRLNAVLLNNQLDINNSPLLNLL